MLLNFFFFSWSGWISPSAPMCLQEIIGLAKIQEWLPKLTSHCKLLKSWTNYVQHRFTTLDDGVCRAVILQRRETHKMDFILTLEFCLGFTVWIESMSPESKQWSCLAKRDLKSGMQKTVEQNLQDTRQEEGSEKRGFSNLHKGCLKTFFFLQEKIAVLFLVS